ncbi:MAG: hypothetical protein EA419_10010 [Wenzhouxiangella sp.]|nr:MAG: hypothetical protein EA419_10010 [Wenzhouxiangella sp.]
MLEHRSNGFVCAAAFSLAALILWAVFTTWALYGNGHLHLYSSLTLKPDPRSWHLVEGEGLVDADGFVISAPSRMGHVVLAIELPKAIQASRFDLLELDSIGAEGRPVTISWSSLETFTAFPGEWLEWISDDQGKIRLGNQRHWQGEIYFLAVQQVGFAGGEWSISSLTLHPVKPDFPTLQRDLLRGWFALNAWRQSDVNLVGPRRDQTLVSPLIAVAGWVFLSMLILVLLAPRARRPNLSALILIPFLAGWVVLDLRWQADLFGKAHHTLGSFAGVEPRQRGLADHDGRLYAFINELQPVLESRHVNRVFVFSPHEFWRKRARYHLAPWAARAGTDGFLSSASVAAFAPGDVLLLLDVEGLEARTANTMPSAAGPVAVDLWFDGAPAAMDFEMLVERGSWYSVAVIGPRVEQ